MTNQQPINFFNLNNLKILEEEKPRICDKIQENQIKKFTFNPTKTLQRNNSKFSNYEYEHSERSKVIFPINSQTNIMKHSKNFLSENNSINENNNLNFQNKRMNTYSSAIFNVKNLKIKNIDYNNDKNIMELIFNKLGIGNIYLEKMYSNKIDFNDLLLLTKDDLKEMNIPIGPRNRILSFIKNYSLYKENFNNNNLNSINQFFNLNNVNINTPNSTISNDNLCNFNSPTINIKTKYNNNFSTNVDNSILIKQEIKNYLNNNPNNLTINVNKTLGVKKKNSYYQKSKSPFLNIDNSKFENQKRNHTIEHNNNIKENYENYFNRRQKKNNSNIHNDNYKKTFFNFHKNKNKYKPNSKLNYISGSNNSRNTKQFIIEEIKKNKSYSKNKNFVKEKENNKNKKEQKSINSFSEEGLNLLHKMKESLNTKLKNCTKSIGEKKLLLKLLEGKANEN